MTAIEEDIPHLSLASRAAYTAICTHPYMHTTNPQRRIQKYCQKSEKLLSYFKCSTCRKQSPFLYIQQCILALLLIVLLIANLVYLYNEICLFPCIISPFHVLTSLLLSPTGRLLLCMVHCLSIGGRLFNEARATYSSTHY